MYFSPRTKQTNTTPTNHSYRGYRVSPSNRMNFSPVEPYINDQDFYTYRASPQTSEFYENSHPMSQNVKSSGCYRTKRPADMAEIIDHDRFYALNHSVASPYESRNYNHYDNSHDGIRPGMSCLSTRAGPYREEDRFFDHIEANNATYRGAPASTREKANARYLAEKVYAMKMRPQGIMASLAPLARSKSPNHGSTFISSKNTTPVNSQSALRDAGDNGYGEPVVRVGDTSLLDMSNRNRNGLQKGNGTSSQKSIGQGRNEKGQESQMKRVNSSGRFQKSPMRSPERWDGQVVMYQGVRKERNMNMMRMKILEFEEKIHTTMWQVCQRNKRLVLVTLLEGLHYHKLKVAQHFKKKAHMTKAKYFCLWQNFLLGMNLERQRMQQEKQNALAIRFYYKKLLKKSFRNLKDITIPKPKTLQQTPAIHYSSAKDLRQVCSPTMKATVNQNKPGSRNSSQTRSQTPQNTSNKRVPQTDKVIEKAQKKSTSKERTPSAPRQATGTKVITKGTCAPLSSRTSSNHQVVAAKNDTNKTVESIETPGFPTNQFPFPVPTFGKAPLRYYEPSEIQELTELSQSPQKGPTSYKNSGLDQSFGCDNLDQSGENVKGAAFDSILSEIMQGSEGNVDRKRENALAVSLQGKGKDTVKKAVKIDNASIKKNNFVGKQGSPPKTARNHSSPGRKGKDVKDYGGSMTTRGKNEGVQDSPQFAKVCKVDKAKILENRKMKESKSNKCLEEEDVKLEEKMRFAGSHYVNNLKIKALSGLLENYVQVFKDRELYQKHYQRNLLKNSFGAWSEVVMGEAGSEETVSEDTYNEIVERFRFIMLTEKAMRQWKELTRNNKRKLGMR